MNTRYFWMTLGLLLGLGLVATTQGTGCTGDDDDSQPGDDDDDDTTGVEHPYDEQTAMVQAIIDDLALHDAEAQWEVFFLVEPLAEDDVVLPVDGESTFVADGPYYFGYVDHAPRAAFEHDVTFVYIDEASGDVTMEDQRWWPLLGEEPVTDLMIDSIQVASASDYAPVRESGKEGDDSRDPPPVAEYGDAPENSYTYIPEVLAQFPVSYNAGTPAQSGAHTVGGLKCRIGSGISTEAGIDDGSDPDGKPNRYDQDADDKDEISIWTIKRLAEKKLLFQFRFNVRLLEGAPADRRWINVLMDRDKDGIWDNGDRGPEWIWQNSWAEGAPPWRLDAQTPWTEMQVDANHRYHAEFWLRIAVTKEQVAGANWDGRGAFTEGEIEDHYFNIGNWTPPAGAAADFPRPATDLAFPDHTAGVPEKDCSLECTPDDVNVPMECRTLVINFGDRPGETWMARGAEKASAFYVKRFGGNDNVSFDPSHLPNEDTIKHRIETFIDGMKCADEYYLYLIGHGYADGGIWVRNGDTRFDVGELRAILDAKSTHCPNPADHYKQECTRKGYCNLNVIIESCHSGNFIQGDTGLGIPGLNVLTTADVARSCWSMSNMDGAEVSNAFMAAWVNNVGDADGNGTVSDLEAMNHAKETYGGPRSGATVHPGADCNCVCSCAMGGFADLISDVFVYPDKKLMTYDPALDIETWGICPGSDYKGAVDEEFQIRMTMVGDLPGPQDMLFNEYYAVLDADPDAVNYECGCPTDQGDTAYIAQFLDGNWTMFRFTFSEIYGWQNQGTSATVAIDGAELTMTIDSAEAGVDHLEMFTFHPATWTQQVNESVGDTADVESWMFP